MKHILSYLQGFWSFPIALFSAVIVFSLPLKRRRHFWKRLLALLFGFVLLVFVFAACVGPYVNITFYPRDTSLVTMLVRCGIIFIYGVIFVEGICQISLREAIYCASCAYLMQHIAFCIRIFILEFPIPINMENGSIGHFLEIGVVYFLIYLLFARSMTQDGHYVTSAVDSLQLTFSTMIVVLVMSSIATFYDFIVIHAFYAIFCCIYSLYGQMKQQKQLQMKLQYSLQQQIWEQRKEQYKLSRETIDIINRKCHDLKHQVAALRHINDSEKKEAAITSIQESAMIYDAMLETGNEILDTVLTEKSLSCKQNGITLICMADGAQLDFLDPTDTYTLFGNALDNAMEALLRLPEEQRVLRLVIREQAGLVLICVENPYAGHLNFDRDLPISSKPSDGYHGFGLKSMKDIAEKYGGFLHLKTKNQLFSLCVTIPREERVTAEI